MASLKSVLGAEAFGIYVSLIMTGVDVSTCELVLKFFEDNIKPRSSKIVSRAEFNTSFQGTEENFLAYLVRLKKIIANCEYVAMKD